MQPFRVLLTATLVFLAACGSSPTGANPAGNNPTGSGTMSASINGTAWTSALASATTSIAGLYSITGIRTAAPAYTMSLSLGFISGPGTYPLGVNYATTFGGSGLVSHPTLGGWGSALDGKAGTITISTLSASRIAGTFSFTAAPQAGATGTLTVTAGTFDMPVNGTVAPPAANAGARIVGTIGGASFTAATIASNYSTAGSSPLLVISGGGLDRNLGITLSGVSAPGTYALQNTLPTRSITVSGPGSEVWSSQLANPTGSVTITTLSASRIIGTFTATLPAVSGGATGTMVASGSFDVGRQ